MKRLSSEFKENNINFLTHQSMAEYCTFKVGGVVDYFVLPKTYAELQKTVNICKFHNAKFYILGNGTNVLFKDKPSVKVVISLKDMPKFLTRDDQRVIASSNVSLFELNKFCKDNQLTGLEFTFGIPGHVGGSVKGNAGAFGGEIGKFVENIVILDVKTGKIKKINKKDLRFSYRKSNIKDIILSVEFLLKEGDFYKISQNQNEYYSSRLQSQPFRENSAGSIFKRGKNFIPAKLIDELGLKGYQIGGAKVSEKHAGFIVKANDNCTSQDIIDLINFITQQIKEAYNIKLQKEIIIV